MSRFSYSSTTSSDDAVKRRELPYGIVEELRQIEPHMVLATLMDASKVFDAMNALRAKGYDACNDPRHAHSFYVIDTSRPEVN